MILRFAHPAVGLLALALAGPPLALAQEKAGIVATIQGTATAARVHLPEPVALKFKDDVFQNDRIVTGDRSLVRVLLGGKAVVTVRERSALTITETPGRSTINLGIGKIAVAVAKDKMRPGESLEVRTPNAVAAIRGTVFVVEVIRATAQAGTATSGGVTTNIYGLSGFVSVDFSGRVVNLAPNQFVTGTGTAPPSLQVMTPEDQSQALSGLTANPQHVSAGQEDAKDQAMGMTVATFGASPTDPPPAPPQTPVDTCGGGACPEDLIKTEVVETPPQETTLTAPLCCPPSSRGHLTFNGTTEGEPMFLLSGGTLTVGTEQKPVNLFDVTGTTTAVDPTTRLTLGTEKPLQPPRGSPVFQDPVASVTVHGSAFRMDTALLEASAPLLKLTADSTFNARAHAVNLERHAKVSIPNDAVAMISLDKSVLVTGSHLVNVAGGSVLNVPGSLVSLANGSTLTVNGVLLNVSGGSWVTLGKLVSFTGTGNTIDVKNTLAPTTTFFRGGIPVPVNGGAASFAIGIPFALGNGNIIKINGVALTTTTKPADLTGSLIAVQSGGGTVTIGR